MKTVKYAFSISAFILLQATVAYSAVKSVEQKQRESIMDSKDAKAACPYKNALSNAGMLAKTNPQDAKDGRAWAADVQSKKTAK